MHARDLPTCMPPQLEPGMLSALIWVDFMQSAVDGENARTTNVLLQRDLARNAAKHVQRAMQNVSVSLK